MTGDLLLSACTLDSHSWPVFNASDTDIAFSSDCNKLAEPTPSQHFLADDSIYFSSTYQQLTDTPTSDSPYNESNSIPLIDFSGLDDFLNSHLDTCDSTVDTDQFLTYSSPSETQFTRDSSTQEQASNDSSVTNCDVSSSQSDSRSNVILTECQSINIDASNEPDTTFDQYKCRHCLKCFHRKYLYERHLKIHTGDKPFSCLVCKRKFTQKGNLKQHMAVHKSWPNGMSKPIPFASNQNVNGHAHACPYCSKQFSDFNQIKKHLLTHRDEQCFRCAFCPSLFENLEQLLRHLKTSHADAQRNDSPSEPAVSGSKALYQCLDCFEWFDTSVQLHQHASTFNHRPFACQLCDKRFQNKRSLNRHFQLHSNQTFVCTVCSKQFKTAILLKAHQLTHQDVRSNACSKCSATFVRPDQLRRHMLIHDTSKRFQCPFKQSTGCNKEFQRIDKLKQHLSTHASPTWLVCIDCGRSYSNEKTFNLHCLTHSTDKQRLLNSFDHVHQTKLLPRGIISMSELESNSIVAELQSEITIGEESSADIHLNLQSEPSIRIWDCAKCAKLFASSNELQDHVCEPITGKDSSSINDCGESITFQDLLALDDSTLRTFAVAQS